MIRSRRKAHRVAFCLLAVGLPALLIAALLVRPQWPASRTPLASAAGYGAAAAASGRRFEARVGKLVFDLAPVRGAKRGYLALDVTPRGLLLAPDVLVYWTPAIGDAAKGGLAADTLLVGSLAGRATRRLVLPVRVRQVRGSLQLYSLAHGRVLAAIALKPQWLGGRQ